MKREISSLPMRYRLRTLMILLAGVPPIIYLLVDLWPDSVLIVIVAILAVAIAWALTRTIR